MPVEIEVKFPENEPPTCADVMKALLFELFQCIAQSIIQHKQEGNPLNVIKMMESTNAEHARILNEYVTEFCNEQNIDMNENEKPSKWRK